MNTQSIPQLKVKSLSIVLMALLLSFVFVPIERAEAIASDAASNNPDKQAAILRMKTSEDTSTYNYAATLEGKLQAALKQIADLRARMAALNGNNVPVPIKDANCPAFIRTLTEGSTDATTGGDVSRLQRHLAQEPTLYPEAQVTGYFGPATERAVQRFQAKHGIANSGTPETTGYGSVGGQTRVKLGSVCKPDVTSPVIPKPTYTISDVKSVTTRVVDPISGAADDEYTLYTITLKSGTVREVKQHGLAPRDAFEKAVKVTGYIGSIDELLKLAGKEVPDGCQHLTSGTATKSACAKTYGLSDIRPLSKVQLKIINTRNNIKSQSKPLPSIPIPIT